MFFKGISQVKLSSILGGISFGVCLLFSTNTLGAPQFFNLFHVPSAKPLQAGYADAAVFGGMGWTNNNLEMSGSGYIHAQLTPHIAISGSMTRENGGAGLQMSILKFVEGDTGREHYLSAGIANAGAMTTSSNTGDLLLNYYLAYTGALPGGTNIHLGMGSDKNNQSKVVAFTGIDVNFESVQGILEWDGKWVNLGFKYFSSDRMALHVMVSPGAGGGDSSSANLITVGLSISEWFDGRSLVPPMVQPSASIASVNKKKADTLSLEEALQEANLSVKYYYKGQYELARESLEKIKDIFPTAETYSRLGSVYYKLNEVDKALENWDKALALDPQNTTLKSFIEQSKNGAKSNAPPF